MIINHNLMANNAIRHMNANNTAAGKSMQKLSSGLRINSAADDAAGLAISEKMKAQVNGLNQANSNAQDGVSMVQTAEGALNETTSILQRMRTLANQSANGTNTDQDRSNIQDEMDQLTSEINRIGNTTEFNTQKLLNGGIGSTDGQKITEATSAAVTVGFNSTGAASSFKGTITVDNRSFDLSSVSLGAGATMTQTISALQNVTSGGVKLGDLVDITKDTATDIKFTDKSSGASSSITASVGANGSLNVLAKTTVDGDPTLIERAGLQGTTTLGATADNVIAKDSTLKITVGSNSAVEVALNDTTADKTYATKTGADDNVKQAAMDDLIKDVNASLQKAGLSDKVEASLSKDNKVQFISKSGVDISVANGVGTPMTSLGFTGTTDGTAVKNVEQVAGPGAEGTGFNTTFQIGANEGQSMSLNINDMRSAALGITGNAGQKGFTATNTVTNGTTDIKQEAALNVMNKDDASAALTTIDGALTKVSAERGKLGAIQNRLEHTENNLSTSAENLTSAQARITDVDMASEMSQYSKNNILAQAAQAMLAQANQQPQQVLQLLR
ncbi:flagellin [Clostridium autoethanogenum]|uniref:Flagellin n=1 Tax=Clostridium autoethanogenum TaxID=84023 RepID=A0A3M0T261_9CLOT|nr:flagellin [Clostridium autoethanogenum]RMD04335.1 flagellin [Clostridium autoethanogenum]